MQTPNQQPVFISRHTIQMIWQSCLNQSDSTLGILGSKSVRHITHSLFNSRDAKQEILNWHESGIAFCGVFHNQAFNINQMKHIESLLKQYIPSQNSSPFIHLHTNLDTKGCLKSSAWVLHAQQAIELTVELIEDGQ
ncbi:MAG: hypothetical protein R8K49_00650 [Mariprofundaceae bacterium]